MNSPASTQQHLQHHQPRLPHRTLAPEAMRAMVGVSATLAGSTLGRPLMDLLHVRISQLNGCAYCLDMHARELLATGEDLQRLNSLATWREVPFFSERERAALQWAESMTLLRETQAPQADFDALRAHFTDREIVELTVCAAQMNAWNRIGVALRLPVVRKTLVPAMPVAG